MNRTGIEAATVEMPGGHIHVHKAGATGSPVILLSGAGLDNANLSWAHLIPVLAENHRVFAPDWPKQGLSREWDGLADHECLKSVVLAVLDRFGIERAHIVGLSQGGALALAMAIDHPDRVNRVVALAPAGTISFAPVYHQFLWLMAKWPFLNSTLPNLIFRSRKATASFARHALFAGPVDDFEAIVDEIHLEVARSGAGSSDWQNASIGPWRMNIDLRPSLHKISAPTLFIQGDRDIGVKSHQTVAAAQLVPDARIEILEGAGHWSNRQMPDRVNGLIRSFLANS